MLKVAKDYFLAPAYRAPDKKSFLALCVLVGRAVSAQCERNTYGPLSSMLCYKAPSSGRCSVLSNKTRLYN